MWIKDKLFTSAHSFYKKSVLCCAVGRQNSFQNSGHVLRKHRFMDVNLRKSQFCQPYLCHVRPLMIFEEKL